MAQYPHMPDQPDYMRISKEDSCNTLMQAMKQDGLTDRHAGEQIRPMYQNFKVTPRPEGAEGNDGDKD